MTCQECAGYLQSYCDGELETSQMLEVEAHLQACPSCRGAVEAERAFREELRSKLSREPVPPHVAEKLRSALTKASHPPAPGRRAPLLALAASVLLVFGGVLGYVIGESDSRAEVSPLVMELVREHMEVTLRENPAELSSKDTHQVAFWVQGRIGHAVQVPDYSATGIHLLGGRVTRLGGHQAAYIVYEKGRNIVSLFAFPQYGTSLAGLKETRQQCMVFRTAEYRGHQILLWESDEMTYAMVANIGWDELLKCAKAFLEAKQSLKPSF